MFSTMSRSILALVLAAGLVSSTVTIAVPVFADPTYEFILKWGTFGLANGQFNFPRDVAVDNDGNVFVVDLNNNRVQKFTDDGEDFVAQWGGFNYPSHIAVDNDGNVFVTDTNNHRIQKFTNDGELVTTWGTFGGGDGEFRWPSGIAVDNEGYVYVTDGGNRVQKFTDDGDHVTTWRGFNSPSGIAVDNEGYVYVLEFFGMKVQKLTDDGELVTTWGSEGGADGQFQNPIGITVDNGFVYVADSFNHRVQKFTDDGDHVTTWGSEGGEDGQFYIPHGITIDNGFVYVADANNHRIQKFGSGNADPVANAGPNQIVDEGSEVSLDGTGSSDADIGDALTYSWEQDSGPEVLLSSNEVASPTFTAPSVDGDTDLVFILTVDDGTATDSDTVTITIENQNSNPQANAGDPQEVDEGDEVQLAGIATDNDIADALLFSWVQTDGIEVELSDDSVTSPTFTAPQVGQDGDVLEFEFTVNDGIASSADTVTVTVNNVNNVPSADAGDDLEANEGVVVVLDGSDSTDADEEDFTFDWVQTDGPEVTLFDVDTDSPFFFAPAVSEATVLEFELTVNDGLDGSTDTVIVTVNNIFCGPGEFEFVQEGTAKLTKNSGGYDAGTYDITVTICGPFSVDSKGKPVIRPSNLQGELVIEGREGEDTYDLTVQKFTVSGKKITYIAKLADPLTNGKASEAIKGDVTFPFALNFDDEIDQDSPVGKNNLTVKVGEMGKLFFNTGKTTFGSLDFN